MRSKYVLLLLTISACVLLTETKRFGGISFGRKSGGSSYGSHRPSAPVAHHSSGSNVHSYPSSSGLSGSHSNSGHAYPQSPGLSGSNSGSGHAYPPSPGLSGNHPGPGHAYPSNTGTHAGGSYPVQHGSIPTHTVNTHHTVYQTHYVQPPVVIQQSAGSPFGNILTGLWLYNLGRSSSHHYNGNSNSQNNEKHTTNGVQSAPNSDLSDCALLITDRNTNKTERLKLPCELVSTFAPLSENTTATNNATNTAFNQSVTSMSTSAPSVTNVSQSVSVVNVTTPLPIISLINLSENVTTSLNTSDVMNATTPVPLAPLFTTPANSNASSVPLAPLFTTPADNIVPTTSTSVATNSSTNATLSSMNISTTTTTMPPTLVESSTDLKPSNGNSTSHLSCVVEMKIKNVRKRTPVECGMLAKLAAETPLEPPKSHTHTRPKSKAAAVTMSTTLILFAISRLLVHSF